MSTLRKGFDSAPLRNNDVVVRPPEGRGPGQYIQTQGERDGPDDEWNTLPPDSCPWLCHFIPLRLLRLIRSAAEHLPGPHQVATNSREPTLRAESVAALVRRIPQAAVTTRRSTSGTRDSGPG